MYYIYKQLGHPIARGSSSQYYNSGYFVSTSAMQPGDLIFFFDKRFDGSGGTLPTTHVGMYVGNGQFIHASTTSYRVQYVSVSGYYAPYIVGAKRIGRFFQVLSRPAKPDGLIYLTDRGKARKLLNFCFPLYILIIVG